MQKLKYIAENETGESVRKQILKELGLEGQIPDTDLPSDDWVFLVATKPRQEKAMRRQAKQAKPSQAKPI